MMSSGGPENPWRALNPRVFDKGEGINQRASELQRMAVKGMTESDALTALGTALGSEIAGMVARRPALSMEEMVATVCDGVREQAYIAAGLPTDNSDARKLTEEEFNDFTVRILAVATRKTQASDALSGMAKALGALICLTAQRGASAEELIKFSQDAVAAFAREALAAPPR
jgi:hypothetical protein